jgi:hypothetical protein
LVQPQRLPEATLEFDIVDDAAGVRGVPRAN